MFNKNQKKIVKCIKTKINTNIYIGLTDEDNYYLEIVEKEGTKYIVGSWTPNDSAEDIKIIADNLIEFNKLNQLTPAEV